MQEKRLLELQCAQLVREGAPSSGEDMRPYTSTSHLYEYVTLIRVHYVIIIIQVRHSYMSTSHVYEYIT